MLSLLLDQPRYSGFECSNLLGQQALPNSISELRDRTPDTAHTAQHNAMHKHSSRSGVATCTLLSWGTPYCTERALSLESLTVPESPRHF